MTKIQKQQTIEYLTQEFKATQTLIVCDYKGTNVKKLEELRNSARKFDAKVQVIKNTLARIALKESHYPDLDIQDTNIFIWGSDQIALSKVVVKFAETNENTFAIKVGSFDNEKVDKQHIISISKLPSKEELIGMLLSVWTAPARYFVTGLDNLRKQKEQN
ncbi:50S ribosomal protein L10 [Helicobacter fennelliae]|uniref:Large ribosomal subunit protein uL10 n=2 Tax=Helicobacter fennelliae TaxID=215 RepID=T1CZ73_9HELI|nr:50S ribosomal protein L10 [Helicobacter fennelliae]GAD18261.1 LSU ribosomal protein L10p [Helicobacter fennelliae MRY12-0050]SQB97958.1 50S ribosomal protein L10 [Helicobacter fennelliae]STP06831.1 50S ribosomal protein L10 [Helicobacter fennelliae]STQ83620.1 50S ribosomal protein L10 [Helicobacter fennelliae]